MKPIIWWVWRDGIPLTVLAVFIAFLMSIAAGMV